MNDEEDLQPSHDAIGALVDGRASRESETPLASEDPKQEAKRILERAAPKAARRLERIADFGDDKEAVAASTRILESVGLGKTDQIVPHTEKSIPLQDLIVGLVGVGKVLGLKEAEKLQHMEVKVEEEAEETRREAEVPRKRRLPGPVQEGNSPAVHEKGLRSARKARSAPERKRSS